MNWYKKSQTLEYTTKDGLPITFEDLPFNEENRRGWVFHKINATINGEQAGYIKLSYIPKEKWNSLYNDNIWKFRRLCL